jgi:hypothetical protein
VQPYAAGLLLCDSLHGRLYRVRFDAAKADAARAAITPAPSYEPFPIGTPAPTYRPQRAGDWSWAPSQGAGAVLEEGTAHSALPTAAPTWWAMPPRPTFAPTQARTATAAVPARAIVCGVLTRYRGQGGLREPEPTAAVLL